MLIINITKESALALFIIFLLSALRSIVTHLTKIVRKFVFTVWMNTIVMQWPWNFFKSSKIMWRFKGTSQKAPNTLAPDLLLPDVPWTSVRPLVHGSLYNNYLLHHAAPLTTIRNSQIDVAVSWWACSQRVTSSLTFVVGSVLSFCLSLSYQGTLA